MEEFTNGNKAKNMVQDERICNMEKSLGVLNHHSGTVDTKIGKIEVSVAKIKVTLQNHDKLLWFILVTMLAGFIKIIFFG